MSIIYADGFTIASYGSDADVELEVSNKFAFISETLMYLKSCSLSDLNRS